MHEMRISVHHMNTHQTNQSALKRFLWNGLLLTVVSLFMRFVGMSFQLFITKHAGGEAIGLYSVIGGVYGFAVTLATSGIHLGTTRLISEALGRNDTNELLTARRTCMMYAFSFGLLSSLLLFLFSEPIGLYLLKDERTVYSLRILSLSLLPIAVSAVFGGYFTAVRRVYKNAIASVLEQGVRIGLTSALLLWILPKGIESACVALVLGSTCSEIFSALLLAVLYMLEKHKKDPNRLPKSNYHLRKKLFGISLPVAFSAYARSGLLSIEHMLIPIGLTAFFGNRSTALSSFGILQGVALPIVLFPSAIVSSYAGLLIPEIAECRVRKEGAKVKRIVMAIFRGALIFSIGVSGIMLCFSYEIASLMENGEEAAYYLRLLSPLIPIMYLDTATDAILKGHGEQVYCMQVNIMDSLLSVLLVWLLLPHMGMEGYILVIYIAELMNASLSIARLLKITALRPPVMKLLFVPLIAVIGATSAVRISSTYLEEMGVISFDGVLLLTAHIFVSAVLYIVFLFLLGGTSKKELQALRRRIFPKAKTFGDVT